MDEADAAAADDRPAGGGKAVVSGKVHDASGRVGFGVEELLDLAVCRGRAPSLVGRPRQPRLAGRIAGLEGEQAVVGQVVAGAPQDRVDVVSVSRAWKAWPVI
jgi:hypothetical protein